MAKHIPNGRGRLYSALFVGLTVLFVGACGSVLYSMAVERNSEDHKAFTEVHTKLKEVDKEHESRIRAVETSLAVQEAMFERITDDTADIKRMVRDLQQ